jgi:xanthine/uracil permease
MSPVAADRGILYGIEDRPGLPAALVLAIQHVLTMFGSTVAVPLIFGPLLWPVPDDLPPALATQLTALQLTNTAQLISSVMLCSGVATFLQATCGSRLPIIQGVSFSFLSAFVGIVEGVHRQSSIDWQAAAAGGLDSAATTTAIDAWQAAGGTGMQTIAGAVIVGGILEATIGFTGLIGRLRRYLSPVVVGPVIMLIGLALYQVGAPVAASNWPISLLTMALIILFSLVLSERVAWLKLFPMLSAIVAVVTLCWGLGQLGVIKSDNPAFVDTSAYQNSPWLRLDRALLPWGWPVFAKGAVAAVLAGYLASMIESFGDYHACKNMAGAGDPTPLEISRGIGCEGIGCALTGILGGFSSTSYSENIGLVGLTKVASRYVVQLGALVLIALGVVGKFGALAAAIPRPVVGGLYCALFGLIAAVGVKQFAKVDLDSDRNLFIGGFALFMGLSVPFYFGSFGNGAQDIQWMQNDLREITIALGTTGMAVAAILGIALDNLIPGSREERGLPSERIRPGVLVPEAGDV